MMSSLSRFGQLTPLVVVERSGALEVVDGFKRLAAAKRMGYAELSVGIAPLDETAQWAMMLALNRSTQSMTELDEALVLRELVRSGMTQTQISELVQRHKSWVSRRIGLVDRLHPELLEQMKLGVLPAGVARRLLVLPPGNQVQVSAAAQSAGLGPRDTEVLVSLWLKAREPAVRAQLLAQPRAAIAAVHPQLAVADPRLTPQGQQLSRLLGVFTGVGKRLLGLLPPPPSEGALLRRQMKEASLTVCLLAKSLGPLVSDEGGGAIAEVAAHGSSSG
jgi:ParB/RepB/Spo0J family partition protein